MYKTPLSSLEDLTSKSTVIMNKDSVYVMKSRDKSVVTIILMNQAFNTEKIHRTIDRIREKTDLIFVFSDRFEDLNKGIDIPKLANLYEGSFIVGSGQNVIFPVLEAISYSVNIFKCRTILITDLAKLEEGDEITEKSLQKLEDLNASSVEGPIMKIDRLGAADLYSIYHTMDSISGKKERPFWKFWKEDKPEDLIETSPDRKNSLYQSNSQFIFLRSYTARILIPGIKFDEVNEEFEDYVRTFSEPNLNYFFASLIKSKGLDHINEDFLTMSFNGNSRTEGI